jgi:hypothetical protein
MHLANRIKITINWDTILCWTRFLDAVVWAWLLPKSTRVGGLVLSVVET